VPGPGWWLRTPRWAEAGHRAGTWLWQRVDRSCLMAAHRRYAVAGGDALSSAVTYALLLSLLPALLLLAAATGSVGRVLVPLLGQDAAAWGDRAGLGAGTVVLDAVPVGGSDGRILFTSASGPVTVFGTALAVYAALSLFRAGRVAVRTLWGQPVGTGNPVVDLAGDLREGAGLAVVLLATVTTTGLANGLLEGLGLTPAVEDTGQTLVVSTCALAYLYWRLPLPDARVPARARWAAAAAGAIGLVLVTAAGTEYTRLVADARGAVYGALTGLVAALVIGNVSVRLALRALGWQLARYLPLLPDASHPASGHAPSDLWVVIPAHNEATGLAATLEALARQRDADFSILVVDNASTDGTAAVARAVGTRLSLRLHVVAEPSKGLWTALQTGVSYARDRGATHVLRTDADTLPRRGWVAAGRAAFAEGNEFLCGRVVPRRDELPSLAERVAYPAAVRAAALAGLWLHRSRPRAGQRYRTRYRLVHGPSMGFTAELWGRLPAAASGDLRTVIEDVALLNAARTQTVAVRRVESMTVEASLRRLRAWGPKRLLLWHWDRRWTPAEGHSCDIR
jgi:uncharacterized BrkB/YihY/UPF0761 family membrane protein